MQYYMNISSYLADALVNTKKMEEELALMEIERFVGGISSTGLSSICAIGAAILALDAEGHFSDLAETEPSTEPEASYWSIGRKVVMWAREQAVETQGLN